MAAIRRSAALAIGAALAMAPAASAAPASAPTEDDMRPDPWVAASLSVGAPVGLLALSMATPFKELMFFAPATYGAGHLYARDPKRALSMSAGGLGAAVAGAGLGVAVVSIWPGTPAESLSRVLWGGALGVVGFGPYVAWDAMRTARTAEPPAAPPDDAP